MKISIGDLHLYVSTLVLAAVGAGVAVILIILIICCCCCFCQKRDRKDEGRAQKFHGQNPPQVPGNPNGRLNQQGQQQSNPPRIPEIRMVPDRSPPSRFPANLPKESSASSTGSSPLPSHPATRPPIKKGNTVPPQFLNGSFAPSQIMFSYEELAIATNGFSRGNILGEGGFGFVHKGMLPSGKEIAVKSLKSDSGQGEREFRAEVETISRIHHRHLVSLVGYCNTGKQRLLVYELVPNKTLEFHLHGKGQPELDWPFRMKIAIGAAKGLAYLHEDCHPGIIHRDIKAANILLDDNFEAKVADFGLAKFYSILETHISTRVMGSLGYLSPEYAQSGQLTTKSDVYSFGVLLLELITGRKPFDKTREPMDLVELAKPLLITAIEDDNFNYLVDPRIQYCFNHTEMSRMVHCANTCVRKSACRRSQMSKVVRVLEGGTPLTELTAGVLRDLSVDQIDSASEYSSSQYKGDSRGFGSTGMSIREEDVTGEYDAMSSEYGLYASTTTAEGDTRELNTEEVKREIMRSQRPL